MKKKKRWKSNHGAVTVFLTIILVPCLIFVCAFGDVSRVMLSKSQALAASDLAMYSLMANYDEDLKEWYGLVASCQDIDSFYATTKEYFVGMMDANGLEGTASSTFVAYLDALRDGNFSNFLQLDGLDSVAVSTVPGGAMGSNPALIEDGIVEFMKYRGPVVIVENLVERFRTIDFSGLTDSDKNEPIVEAKQEYAEAEGEMLKELLYTYLAIEKYVDYRSATGVPDIDKYQHEYAEDLSKIKDDFAAMTDTITKYYAATDGIKNISENSGTNYGAFPLYSLPTTYRYGGYTYTMADIGAEEDEEGNYSIDGTALETLFENADRHVSDLEDAARRIVDACNGIPEPTAGGDINEAVYCMRIQNAIKSNDLNTIHNNGKSLMQLYAKLLLVKTCEYPSAWRSRINDMADTLKDIQKDYLSYTSNPSSDFEKLLAAYKKAADVTAPAVTNYRYEFYSEFLGRNATVGTFLQEFRNKYGTLINQLDMQIGYINTVLNGGTVSYGGKTYSVLSLASLKQKIVDYSDARDDWGAAAASEDTDFARSEYEEYEGVTQAADLPAALYADGAESVEVLKKRLTNIKSDMETLRNALNDFTYGGVQAITLTRNTAISAAKTVVPATVDPSRSSYISLSFSDNENAARNYHAQLLSQLTYQAPVLRRGEDGNNPELKEDIPAIYKYMREQFYKDDLESAVNEADNVEKENKENREKADKEAEESKGFSKSYLDDLGQNPKETSGDGAFGIGTVLTGLIDTVNLIINGNFDEFRDKIYVVEYVMEMFSYSSYNNEGQYKIAWKKNQEKPLTLSDYDTSKASFKDTGLQNSWKEEDPTKFTDNKSLTNKMINSTNNRSNLAEVEYILYGKATNKDNLETAYGQIFAIREALNLISGFANFYSGTNTTATMIQAIAAAIMAATMGIVPEALTKVILIGLLATLESAHDLKRLKAGIPVAIYKGEDAWFYGFSSEDISSVSNGGNLEPTDKNGIYYSDYLFLFLILSVNDSSLYSDMLLRVGDLVEGNMAQQEGKGEFDLEKSQCYFQMTGNLAVKPLFLKIPLVTNYSGADASRLLDTTDWCSYSLKTVRGYS